jgi:hypothetical protein
MIAIILGGGTISDQGQLLFAVLFRTRVFQMVQTRAAPRYRVMKAAKIEYGGAKAPCMIRDLSVTGAALEISELSGKIPEMFNLIMPEDGLNLPCHVVWRRGFKIGVAFD